MEWLQRDAKAHDSTNDLRRPEFRCARFAAPAPLERRLQDKNAVPRLIAAGQTDSPVTALLSAITLLQQISPFRFPLLLPSSSVSIYEDLHACGRENGCAALASLSSIIGSTTHLRDKENRLDTTHVQRQGPSDQFDDGPATHRLRRCAVGRRSLPFVGIH
ncbi:hypothetical protein HPB50_017435 [Hyalomma asiaticum]|uniref:Uncharacterized protein n=1 Tax=Hyalomma asiaticum TaxID=266040 RepID=A0ACB7SG49_HYAAI|nr:hypothetical protein HPB50_017435 [Hyalomma asiaticum]